MVDQARKHIAELRSELVLDAESDRLLLAMTDVLQQCDVYVIALDQSKTLADAARAAAEAGPALPPVMGSREAYEKATKRGDVLFKAIREVIDSARETLSSVEQPIA